jgi:uncharacterized CHY-type Zn-finger protein
MKVTEAVIDANDEAGLETNAVYGDIVAQSKNCGVNSRPLLVAALKQQQRNGVFFQPVPMAVHATMECHAIAKQNSTATEELCFLRSPCRDIISRTGLETVYSQYRTRRSQT